MFFHKFVIESENHVVLHLKDGYGSIVLV